MQWGYLPFYLMKYGDRIVCFAASSAYTGWCNKACDALCYPDDLSSQEGSSSRPRYVHACYLNFFAICIAWLRVASVYTINSSHQFDQREHMFLMLYNVWLCIVCSTRQKWWTTWWINNVTEIQWILSSSKRDHWEQTCLLVDNDKLRRLVIRVIIRIYFLQW